jgi:hypothetical protein
MILTEKICAKNSEEFEYCAWTVYMDDDMHQRSQRQVELAMTMLKKLDTIVAKNFPNRKYVDELNVSKH